MIHYQSSSRKKEDHDAVGDRFDMLNELSAAWDRYEDGRRSSTVDPTMTVRWL